MSPIASRNGGNDSRTLHVHRRGAAARASDPPEPSITDRLADPALAPTVSPDDLLAQLFAEQNRAWKAGRGTAAEDLLAHHPAFAASADAFLLVYNEFLLREELGQNPDPDEYVWRFPAYAAQLREQLRLRRVCASGVQSLTGGFQAPTCVPHAAPPPAEALPTVAGYEILCALGKGGMGTVYKARQIGLNRIVALKMIRGGPFADPEFQARFRLEAEAVARMQHPNIVQIYEIGVTTSALGLGYPFISLEFVDGGDLAANLGRTPQPPARAAALVETLAHAVHYAHQHGIAHRDLKPANILLQRGFTAENAEDAEEKQRGKKAARGGEAPPLWPASSSAPSAPSAVNLLPKIADFGLAKPLAGALDGDTPGPTLDGTVVGTPEYMAPEQAAGRRDVGPPADVYALGVILYEMLTGRCPFEGQSPVDTMDLVRSQEPLPPRRLVPHVPRDLETVCLRCLEKDPARRYPTAQDLAEDLRRYLDGDPVRARPVGPAERLRRWARKRPAVAGLLGCLVAVTLAGLLTVLWQWSNAVAARARAEANERDAVAAEEAATWSAAEATTALAAAKEARSEAEAAHRATAAALDLAEANLYFGHIAQASLHWRLNNVRDAAAVLDLCPPARRGWEWRYLRGLHTADLFTLPRGKSWVHVEAVAYSPDGTRLAVTSGSPYLPGGGTGELNVFDAHTGALVRNLPQPPALCDAVVYSPDGKRLASGCRDGSVRICDAETGRELRELKGHRGEVKGVAWSPDGRRIAVGDTAEALRIWDVDSGREVLPAVRARGLVYSVVFSPDGRYLALGDAHRGWLHDAATGLEVADRPDLPARPVFSRDGRRIAGTRGGRAEVLDFATRKVVQTLVGHDGNVLAAAFSPDGLSIATAGADSTVRLWDAASGAERLTLRGHIKRVTCLAFHPSGRTLASGGHQPGEVKVWDLTRQQEHTTVSGDDGFRIAEGVGFLDSSRIAVASSGAVRVRDAVCGTLQRRFIIGMCNDWLVPARKCAFSADGRVFAAMSGDRLGVEVWDVTAGKQTGTLTGHTLPVVHVAVSGDGKRVVTGALGQGPDGGAGREVRVWERETGKILCEYRGPAPTVLPFHGGVALSGDGRRVAFDVCTLQPLPNNRVAATLAFVVCDVDAGKEVGVVGLTGLPGSVALSADGATVAAVDGVGQVLVCAAAGGKRLHSRPLQGPSTELAFSPDGRCLAGVDRELVKVWSVATGRELLTLRGAPPRSGDGGFNPHVAWSPDGRRLAAINHDRNVSVWDAGERTAAERRAEAEGRAFAWHLREHERAAEGRDEHALEFHSAELSRRDPPGDAARAEWGEMLLRRGLWDESLTVLRKLDPRTAEPTGLETWLIRGVLHRLANDAEGYRALREALAARLARSDEAARHTLVRTLLLADEPPGDADEQSRRLLASRENPEPWYLTTRAIAAYRAGRYAEAVRLADKSDRTRSDWDGKPLNAALRAAVAARRGDAAAARRWLTACRDWLGDGPPSKVRWIPGMVSVADWLECLLLAREVESLLAAHAEE